MPRDRASIDTRTRAERTTPSGVVEPPTYGQSPDSIIQDIVTKRSSIVRPQMHRADLRAAPEAEDA
jgi:hypothetical protein